MTLKQYTVEHFENMRIEAYISTYGAESTIDMIRRNYRIYLGSLKKKRHPSRVNFLKTILYYRKFLREHDMPYGANNV